jgi:CRISPR-associated protein Cmr5
MAAPTLSQRRARHAWEVVEAQRARPKEDFEEFADQAKKLPTRIMTSGLGQSLAFLRGKKKAAELREALSDWMQAYQKDSKIEDLLDRVVQGDSDFQRMATWECLAYLAWLVRFADAHREE